MKVRDDDFCPIDIVEHIIWDNLAGGIVAVGIVWLQNAQPVLDSQAGRTHKEAAGELLAVRAAHRVDGFCMS